MDGAARVEPPEVLDLVEWAVPAPLGAQGEEAVQEAE